MLHQRLLPYMWWGVLINIVAMILVSITNFVGPESVQPDGASNPALGALFILLSCVVQVSLQLLLLRGRTIIHQCGVCSGGWI